MTTSDALDRDSVRREDAAVIYARLHQAHTARRDVLNARSRRMAFARVATFLGGATCLIVAASVARAPTLWLSVAGGILVFAFFALVVRHSRIEQQQRREEALTAINDIALCKLRRDWSRVPVPAVTAPASHPYAEDLDLFGRASLFALLWGGGTQAGQRRLADWLLSGAAPAAVTVRQAAVEELAPLVELRQQILAAARTGDVETHDTLQFLSWSEGAPWLSAHPIVTWLVRGLTLAILLPIALQLAGLTHRMYWVGPLVVSFVVSNLLARRVMLIFNRAFAQQSVFRSYAELFHLISSIEFRSPLLRDLQAALVVDGLTADRQMARLQRIMELADLRHSGLLHGPVQVLTLWDYHVLLLLERWQSHAGRAARRWFDVLATFEALEALAGLSFDNPRWVLPEISEPGDALDASAIGHPLLPPGARVDNDVRIGPRGTFLLVTGSNMSGKSTLLRAIGVNVVLAQAGGPACAARMRLPAVRLYTSMRVLDSLEQGVSFFMAAVNRLKQVVEAADQARPDEPLLLYLLDEVLQGTNTAERQIAVRSIMRHLVARRAIGAVTTHDLTLAATPEFSASAQLVHFTERLEETGGHAAMTFDYRLRPGLATSRNALRLMQMVGLEVEPEDGDAR